ncbi:MAG TPA: hypothetical protein VGL54_08855 [Solirubrobacteraceae bacterium]|jgi:transcriptional regulator with XRE-family HTH domain
MAVLDIARLSDCVVNEFEPRMAVPAASSLLLTGTLAGAFSPSKVSDYISRRDWSPESELLKPDLQGVLDTDVLSKGFYTEASSGRLPALARHAGSELSWADLTLVMDEGSLPADESNWLGSTWWREKTFGVPEIMESVPDDSGAISMANLLDSFVVRSVVNRSETSEFVAALGATSEYLRLLVKNNENPDSEARVERLRESATSHARHDGKELLDELALRRGLAWQTIATMLGVTSAAIRKWRRGGSVAPENRAKLATLVAFFEQIEEPIADLGSWVEMCVREDTTLTPAEIYRAGPQARWLLIEWTSGNIDTVTMLNRFDDSWRENYARDPNFRVGVGPDGERAIVPR